ncbi:hypothetical protein BcepSauron_174 [Burkholderia phage BcepSauron]|uniref:J domain-containing protein n=1 Tax=Burkholderia phage BcepSauron TaxID=2530033 RepID=A0A482ML96_9CAUD|nr:hypothetical protein H1O17_gp174 [Burkholderia phage BcepSauron]QBQ74554.1 hypothetical protein BcepSauron_174 [Burkholderia phage BcepSauron]
MEKSTGTALAIPNKIDIAAIARFHALRAQIKVARERYYRLHASVLRAVNSLYEEDERHDTVVRLRREIRLATRGMPVREAHEPVTAAGYISFGTEQLYNAETELVADAYRKVRTLVHPDHGGDAELFQLVKTAYLLRDLTFLLETRLMLEHGHDLAWMQGPGIEWAEQEIQRPVVSTSILQATPEFAIARLLQQGKRDVAKSLASRRLAELVVTLQAELNHIRKGRINGNNEEEVACESAGDACDESR